MRPVGQYLLGYGVDKDMFDTPSFAGRFNKLQRGGPAGWLDSALSEGPLVTVRG